MSNLILPRRLRNPHARNQRGFIINPYVFAAAAGPSLDSVINGLGPWGYWKCNETGTITTINDSSGNGRHGAVSGTGFTAAPAILGGHTGSIATAGTGRINLPDFTVAANQSLSIMVFMQTTSASLQHLLSADDSGGSQRRWQFRLTADIQEYLVSSGGSTSQDGIGQKDDGVLHQLGFSHNATTNECRLYQDGLPKGSLFTSFSDVSTGVARLALGSRSNVLSAELFNGTWGGAVFFDKALVDADFASTWAARNNP